MELTLEIAAKILHETTRVLPRVDGTIPVCWDELTNHQQEAAMFAVNMLVNTAPKSPEQLHDLWRKINRNFGWVYGPTYDIEKLEHPSMVPFDNLSNTEKLKDELWSVLIEAFRPYLTK